jgi:hypothetical protein
MLRNRPFLLLLPPLIVVMILFPELANAKDDKGWYINAGAGLSQTDVPSSFWTDSSITDSSMETEGPGYQIGLGYQLYRHFALEVDYLRAAETKFRATSNGTLTLWTEGKVHGITRTQGYALTGIGYWSPKDKWRLQLYAKGGIYLWDTLAQYGNTINAIRRFQDDGATLIGGAGAQFRLSRDWELRAEGLYSTVRIGHRQSAGVGFATLGLLYRLQ